MKLLACAKNGEHFLDPSCGIFHGTKASHLRDFLAAWFGHSFVTPRYGHDAASVIAARKPLTAFGGGVGRRRSGGGIPAAAAGR